MELSAHIKIDLRELQKFDKDLSQGLQDKTGPIGRALKQWGFRYRSFVQERFDKYSKGGGDWKPLSDRTKFRRRKGTKGAGKLRLKKFKKRTKGKNISVLDKQGRIRHVNKDRHKGGKKGHNTRTKLRDIRREIVETSLRTDLNPKQKNAKVKRLFKKLHNARKRATKQHKANRISRANARIRSHNSNEKQRWLKESKHSILRDTGTLFAALSPTFSGKPGAVEENIPFGIRVGYGGPARHTEGGEKSPPTIADIASFHQNGTSRLPKREIIVAPDSKTIRGMISDMERAIDKLKGT